MDWADLFTNKQVALLQPAPETVALFDDVLLLSDGHVAYHGPLQDMLSYFEGLGFMRPTDMSLQEWVQELTGPVDQEVRCMFIRNCL
jgi:ABC-type multidrug transport system ATPase subunit